MLKLIASLSMLLLATTVLSDDGKPTKEQTIEYIQANYPTAISYSAGQKDARARSSVSGQISDLKITIVDTTISVSYREVATTSYSGPTENWNEPARNDEHHIQFDLAQIELLGVWHDSHVGMVMYDEADTGNHISYLVFMSQNNKPLITAKKNGQVQKVSEARIPFGRLSVRNTQKDSQAIFQTQLFKAFQHLRKLSGAPEPIRF